MIRVLMRYTCGDTGVSRNGVSEGKLSSAVGDQIKWDNLLCRDRDSEELCIGVRPSSSVTMRYAVLVTGPAGAGKSTFCASFMTHLLASKRTGHLVNLDPAAAPDRFEYAPSIDIKDLISVDDAMSELGYGPNGGLVYCFEYVSAPFVRPER
jgi:Conserved hypothetical ATP binding protein